MGEVPMPWKASGAGRHTKKAKTPAQKKRWSKTANAVLAETGDEGKAIRIANARAKKGRRGKK